MARGLEKHSERLDALNRLGKALARRSGAKCELCGAAGVALRTLEVPPVPVEPELSRCAMVCDTCKNQLEKPKKMETNHWRCAAESVWSEVPAVQVLSARVLDRLSKDELWAREALEMVSFDEEVEEWIRSRPL